MDRTQATAHVARRSPRLSGVRPVALAQDALGAILEGIDVGVWHFVAEGRRLFASAPAYRLVGASGDDPVRYEDWLTYIHPQDRQRVRGEIAQALATPGSFVIEARTAGPGGPAPRLGG